MLHAACSVRAGERGWCLQPWHSFAVVCRGIGLLKYCPLGEFIANNGLGRTIVLHAVPLGVGQYLPA